MFRYLLIFFAFSVPVAAGEPGELLVEWTNAKLGDDGVLEPRLSRLGSVCLEAGPSTFSAELRAARDGVGEIDGNAVVLWLDDGKDHRHETLDVAVKEGHFAEFTFTATGLPEGAELRVTGLSYEARPNCRRRAEVHGAIRSRVSIDGVLVGTLAKHEPGKMTSHTTLGLDQRLVLGQSCAVRVHFAGFDSEAKAGRKFKPFHAGIQLGKVQVFGYVVAAAKSAALPSTVQAVLQEHCFTCHGDKEQKGGIRLDTLSIDFMADRAAAEVWHDVLNVVATGEMPPEGEPRPSEAARGALTGWIRREMAASLAAARLARTDIVMRRLNKDEYRYTLTDLLGVASNYGERLPADPLSTDGFANDGETLGMSALQIETYLASARAALEEVLVDGPQPERTETRIVDQSAEKIGIGKENVSRGGHILDRTGVFGAIFGGDPEERAQIAAEGRFTIRVKARAEFQPGQPAPIMRVVYGYRIPGAIPIYKEVSRQEITDKQAQVYEFHGLAQNFPYALQQSDLAVQVVAVENVLTDGQVKLPPAILQGKTKARQHELDPDFPRLVIDWVQLVGNDYPEWPPAEHRRILPAAANEGTPEYAREVLRRFLHRAWRGSVSDGELDRYHQHFLALSQQMPFVGAMRETLAVALSSPYFLYLVEPQLKRDAVRLLDDHEIAARLSCFLWSSMPDEALLGLAGQGRLKEPEVLAGEVQRLLMDPKAQRFVEQFTTQWLDLGGLERVAVNPQYYPGFKDELKVDMAGETKAYFGEILRTGTSALQFLDSDWTMINAPLARHYRLKGPQSQAFVRVSLVGTRHPGGLLGHASMHLSNSNGEDSHPIKRALWIRERLLHDSPPSPPPNVPALPAEDPSFVKLSIREQLQLHRQDPACSDCHRSIDPWGIALEHYDAVGLWRDVIRRPSGEKDLKGSPIFQELPVVAKDTLPGGIVLDGLDSLKKHLLNECQAQFAKALVSKLFAYALGRSIDWSDEETIQQLSARFAEGGYQLPQLITDIVVSPPFLAP
jgi:mono/diheme cytochrome c family protein